MRTSPSKKMLKARSMRKQKKKLDEIALALKVTKAGARYLLQQSDKFCSPPLGTYEDYKKNVVNI